MGYFAGLDVSMEETHICILDREGVLVREGKASSTPKMIRHVTARFLAVNHADRRKSMDPEPRACPWPACTGGRWRDWFLAPDQQGQISMNNRNPGATADLFRNLSWLVYARLRAGRYEEVAEV